MGVQERKGAEGGKEKGKCMNKRRRGQAVFYRWMTVGSSGKSGPGPALTLKRGPRKGAIPEEARVYMTT